MILEQIQDNAIGQYSPRDLFADLRDFPFQFRILHIPDYLGRRRFGFLREIGGYRQGDYDENA
jgi:hypothetical protein